MKKLFFLSVITAAIFSTQVMAKKPAEGSTSENKHVTESKHIQKEGVKFYPPETGSGFITPEKSTRK
ncbi:hypothetical protein [Symbiopectobacterium purcellii]|uniref:hypothetical protein n=1 Tax=Symbiopectobacterium purcellii TaxID=2871826 RepID=UPI003F855543